MTHFTYLYNPEKDNEQEKAWRMHDEDAPELQSASEVLERSKLINSAYFRANNKGRQ